MNKDLLIPPIIADCIYYAVSGVSEVQFLHTSGCPECSGPLISHDLKKRRFSTIKTPEGITHINVYVKRFHCRDCGHLCYADAPFYENSRFGSPIIDLCLVLSRTYSYSYTSHILDQVGIIIDRGTVRKIAQKYDHQVKVVDLYGIQLPASILALSALGMKSAQSAPLSGPEVLQACGFPEPL